MVRSGRSSIPPEVTFMRPLVGWWRPPSVPPSHRYIYHHTHPTSRSLDRKSSSWSYPETGLGAARALRPLQSVRFVKIRPNVWLREQGVRAPGVTMGEAGGAETEDVVTADLPCFVSVAGLPAQPIRRDVRERQWMTV